MHFGTVLFQKLGVKRSSDIRQRLRACARLLLQLRVMSSKPEADMQSFITPQYFDTVIQAVKVVAQSEPMASLNGHQKFDKPSLALRLGHHMKKMAFLKQGLAIRENAQLSSQLARLSITNQRFCL